MKTTLRFASIPALTLALAAGTTAPAWAQNTERPAQREKETDRPAKKGDRAESKVPDGVDFRSCHWLKGRDVANSTGEKVADVEDLVLDRGSGRVEYVVLKTGSVLNMGGKSVAVPFASLRWNPGKDHFVLETTPEQLKQYPTFTAERWSEMLESRSKDSKELKARPVPADPKQAADGKDNRHILPDSPGAANLYAGHFDVNQKQHIEGEVTGVERVRSGRADEEVIVTIAASDGSTRRVSLGPSWYVTGGAAAPMRGDRVIVDGYQVKSDSSLSTASRARIGDREVILREADGSPRWSSSAHDTGERSYSPHYWHYVLASSVRGMKVECRGTECGKVNDVIVDRGSGEVAMLSIDPNQNVLGIADTKRLVPWTVANISVAGTVRLDATKEMILASPETPSDLSTLNTSDRTRMVFDAYHVPMPEFEARKNVTAVPPNANGRDEIWGANGLVVAGMERESSKSITGKLVSVSEIKLDKEGLPAKAMRVRTASGEEETVLLGPAWYVESQGATCPTGSNVTMEVTKTRVNGKSYWITRSWEHDGKRIALWNNDGPMWGDR